jgi:hypothetical protein
MSSDHEKIEAIASMMLDRPLTDGECSVLRRINLKTNEQDALRRLSVYVEHPEKMHEASPLDRELLATLGVWVAFWRRIPT